MPSLSKILQLFGVNTRKTAQTARTLPTYFKELKLLRRQLAGATDFPITKNIPCLEDRYAEGGTARGHYFHQDLLVARRVFQNNPEKHLDIGSRIDGFVAHVASFRAIDVMDIRPLSNEIPNIHFVQADLMQPMDKALQGSYDSMSCLHALEHFGLGRYGDPIQHDGHLVGLKNMGALLKTGGKFYFSTPIGPQRIEFNAHRVFSVQYLLNQFKSHYVVDQFSYVDDRGSLHTNEELTAAGIGGNFGCKYGCGIFEMTKTA
ncbi:DUF268 domain-containing protein [Prosthecobacter sp.]|uniref:DUF268 domain-containing protein n=1 Tax=Prosthecobacter sp. TaxID=1965333 RepID=UPI00378468DE